MPQVVPAVAAAVSWVTTAVASAGALMTSSLSAYAGLSVGTAAAITNAVGSLALSAGLSAATTALMAPRTGGGGSPTSFKADPNAPISGVMGRFGVGGRQVHMRTWGKENLLISYVTVLSLGPISAIPSFTANSQPVTFPGPNGLAANVEPYKDKMWMTNKLGLPTDGALSPPPHSLGTMSPAWTVDHKTSGYAASFWTMQNNSKKASYEGGVPRPVWTIHGMLLWDPRKDSTYPGGSGTQRRDNWTTWAYTENPYLHALAWARGHHKNLTGGLIDRSKRLAGVGAPDDAIDIAAFVEGANVADANSWKIAGEWTTADDKWNVLAAMLQAGGGVPSNRGAQISCMVNAPRASLMTVTGADLAGPVSLKVMSSRRDRFNTIIPRYRDENQKWEEVAAGPVTSSTYLTEDRNEPRTREISYVYVRQAKQAAELGAYDLANARESLTGSLPSKPYLLNLRAGDAFTVMEPELGLNGQKFIVLKRGFDPGSAVVTLDVRSETDAKHAWALGQSANAPPSPSLTPPNPIPVAPAPEEWTVTPRPPEPGGGQQPGLILGGTVSSDNVGSVLVEVSASSSGPWEQVYQGPPTTETVYINGLEPGSDYFVSLIYYSVKGVPSARSIYGPYTAPGFISEDTANVGGVPAPDLLEVIGGHSLDLDQIAIDMGLLAAGTATAMEQSSTAVSTANGAAAAVEEEAIARANADAQMATRTSKIEAGILSVPNLLRNSDFSAGLRNWSQIAGGPGAAGWAVYNDPAWGSLVGALGGTDNTFLISDPIRVYPGQYTVSWNGDGGSVPAGTWIYFTFLNESLGVVSDGQFLTDFTGVDWYNRKSRTITVPSGVAYVKLQIQKTPGTNNVFASRIMFNVGAFAAVWTDQATARDTAARVSETEAAIAGADGLLAFWKREAAVPGASAFIVAQAKSSPGSPPTSSVGLGADVIALGNPTEDGGYRTAMITENGNTTFYGAVSAQSFALLTNGTPWNFAYRSQKYTVADGQAISYPNFGVLPEYEFLRDNLLPLNETIGESYDLKLTSMTATGATVSAKINVPGTSGSQSNGPTTTVQSSGPRYQLGVTAASKPESASGLYTVSGQVSGTVRVFGGAEDMPITVSGSVVVWARKGGVWAQVGAINWSSTGAFSNPSDTPISVPVSVDYAGTLQMGSGVESIGVTYGSGSLSGGNVSRLSTAWTSQSAPSGTRSALAAGATTTLRIIPQG